MNHKKLTKSIHDNAVDKGFWDKPDHDRFLILIITEMAEAVEADRKNRKARHTAYAEENSNGAYVDEANIFAVRKYAFEKFIKDSVEDELADTIIRIYDFAGGYGYTLCDDPFFYQETKDWMKSLKLVTRDLSAIMEDGDKDTNEDRLNSALNNLLYICKLKNIDIDWHITEKMLYNSTREKLHGKAY